MLSFWLSNFETSRLFKRNIDKKLSMFSFCTNSRLIAKKTNTSAVVIGCRKNNNPKSYKTLALTLTTKNIRLH